MPIRIMPGEVTPTLFVGLGGSGGRAVGRIAKRLRAHEDFDHQFRGLIRFLAIDTNDADLARLRKGTGEYGRVDDTVLISDFDKVAYSQHRRGESFADADAYFNQWVHDWYRFRKESGAGAGQIRIESRLSFYRSVEVGDLGQKLASIVSEMRAHGHGMRSTGAPLQVFVYFSVAGGTGSGAFLPFAYLCRDVVEDRSARMVGFAILPEAFEAVVGQNRDGTFANGYAALKELEHLMKLDTQAPSSPTSLEFHYDPRSKHKTAVERRPYDLVYLVDRPQNFSLDDVGAALADATYVQIFSPILGDQQADFDNYTKESRRLFPDALNERGEGYTAFYGTLGSAVMILPKGDILEYAARRYAATAVRRYLLLDDPALVSESQREQFKRFSVDQAELARLAPDAQRRRVDDAFVAKLRLLGAQDQADGPWKRALGLLACWRPSSSRPRSP
ncbi:MAG: tubulin-like doman-containing protein [Nannocystaceae bacterium]